MDLTKGTVVACNNIDGSVTIGVIKNVGHDTVGDYVELYYNGDGSLIKVSLSDLSPIKNANMIPIDDLIGRICHKHDLPLVPCSCTLGILWLCPICDKNNVWMSEEDKIEDGE